MNIKMAITTLYAGMLFFGSAAGSFAADLYLIAHSGVTLTAAEAREVFLGTKQFSGPIKLVPVDNAAAQEEFLNKVIKLDSAKYSTSWTKKSFRDGLIPPAVKSGDVEVIEFVKRAPGAVGYVGSSPRNVNVIQQY